MKVSQFRSVYTCCGQSGIWGGGRQKEVQLVHISRYVQTQSGGCYLSSQ